MWHYRRVGLLAALLVVVSGGSALASLTPSLSVSSSPTAATVTYSQGASDSAFSTLTMLVPIDYFANLSQLPGASIGTFTGTGSLADQAGASVPLVGTITAAGPSDGITYGGVATSLSQIATCAGTGAAHTASWIVTFTASGTSIQLPLFVDTIVNAHNPYGDQASFALTLCQPPSAIAAGTVGRAPLGLSVTSATFDLKEVFSVSPGWYPWNAAITPYAANIPQPTQGVSTQSIDRTPQTLTLKSKPGKKGTKSVTVSGKLSAGGAKIAGATITITTGKKTLGKLKTTTSGAYSGTIKLATKSATLLATTSVPATATVACTNALFATIPCTGQNNGAYTTTSTPTKATTT
jgi:hypothetical protein